MSLDTGKKPLWSSTHLSRRFRRTCCNSANNYGTVPPIFWYLVLMFLKLLQTFLYLNSSKLAKTFCQVHQPTVQNTMLPLVFIYLKKYRFLPLVGEKRDDWSFSRFTVTQLFCIFGTVCTGLTIVFLERRTLLCEFSLRTNNTSLTRPHGDWSFHLDDLCTDWRSHTSAGVI